jgi:hypothetical protein
MHAPDHFYRRRFVHEPGLRHVFHDYGPALVWRDDSDCWGCDFVPADAAPLAPMKGRDIDGRPGVIIPIREECRYGRLWAWRARPLWIFEMYGPDGVLAATRIDFATPLAGYAGALYQTDLYLDVFVAADGGKFLVEDEDELETARGIGLISHEQYRLVRAQQRELIGVLGAGNLAAWLGLRPPFDPAAIPPYRGSIGRYIRPDEDDGWPEGMN